MKKKNLFSLLIVAVMFLSMFPIAALAAGGEAVVVLSGDAGDHSAPAVLPSLTPQTGDAGHLAVWLAVMAAAGAAAFLCFRKDKK